MNIERVKTKAELKFIEIMDESHPYPYFLGINCNFDNNATLNLKNHQMSFETDTIFMVSPLDPYEDDRYNEIVNEDAQSSTVENIYKVMTHRDDYINPNADEELSWRSFKSYDIDSEDALDRWKINIYELLTRRCT